MNNKTSEKQLSASSKTCVSNQFYILSRRCSFQQDLAAVQFLYSWVVQLLLFDSVIVLSWRLNLSPDSLGSVWLTFLYFQASFPLENRIPPAHLISHFCFFCPNWRRRLQTKSLHARRPTREKQINIKTRKHVSKHKFINANTNLLARSRIYWCEHKFVSKQKFINANTNLLATALNVGFTKYLRKYIVCHCGRICSRR